MKYKKIMSIFAIVSICSIVIRTVYVFFALDKNGFTLSRFEQMGYKMMVVIFGGIVTSAVLGALVHRYPEKPPVISIPLGISATILGVYMILDLFILETSPAVPSWEINMIKLLGVVCGLIWIIYSLSGLIKVKIPAMCFVVPVAYWIFRLIYVFTMLNTLAVTTGHILLLVSSCANLLFAFFLSRLMNGVDKEYNFKKLMASGIASVSLSGCFSVPYIITYLLGNGAVFVEGFSSVLLTFVTGVFNLVFLICYFRDKNLRRKSRHSKKRRGIDRRSGLYIGN